MTGIKSKNKTAESLEDRENMKKYSQSNASSSKNAFKDKANYGRTPKYCFSLTGPRLKYMILV